MTRLDTYDKRPSGMDKYLSVYGWHFSKAMAMFAAAQMFPGQELPTAESIRKISDKYPAIKAAKGYDAHFLLLKYKIFFGMTFAQVAAYVEKILSGSYETMPFTNFYSDSIALGIPIIWEDRL